MGLLGLCKKMEATIILGLYSGCIVDWGYIAMEKNMETTIS